MESVKIRYFAPSILLFSLIFSQFYTFSENIRLTESSDNQKFQEVAITNNYIHLVWVAVSQNYNDKNIMYSKSSDFGESFSSPTQINFTNNNIVAYSQSGPKIAAHENRVYVTYTDNRNGVTSVYLNVSHDYGETWEEEIVIADTPHVNMYQDIEVDAFGDFHIVYFNYGADYHLEDVRYRFSPSDSIYFNDSYPVGIVDETQEPCDCCQPDLEIDSNGDVYLAYRNNILNNRDTFLAIKRNNQNSFSEYYQASNFNDYVTFCPSSGPTIDIKDNSIAVAYTVYHTQNGYVDVSSVDEMVFYNPINLNTESSGFPNYPYVAIDDNAHIVWADQTSGNWDVYYGMRDIETGTMQNIQKINDDDTNYIQKDQTIYMYDDTLYLFWTDQRNGNYEIYLSKGESITITLGDVNQDTSIDILDIILVVNYILGQESPGNAQFFASDLNADSIINIQDIILLLDIILN